MAHNRSYRDYLDLLSQGTEKYAFDVRQDAFQNLYRDTVLALYGRGFLFDDDPELISIQQTVKVTQPNPLSSITLNPEDVLPALQQAGFDLKTNPLIQSDEEARLVIV